MSDYLLILAGVWMLSAYATLAINASPPERREIHTAFVLGPVVVILAMCVFFIWEAKRCGGIVAREWRKK